LHFRRNEFFPNSRQGKSVVSSMTALEYGCIHFIVKIVNSLRSVRQPSTAVSNCLFRWRQTYGGCHLSMGLHGDRRLTPMGMQVKVWHIFAIVDSNSLNCMPAVPLWPVWIQPRRIVSNFSHFADSSHMGLLIPSKSKSSSIFKVTYCASNCLSFFSEIGSSPLSPHGCQLLRPQQRACWAATVTQGLRGSWSHPRWQKCAAVMFLG